MIFMQYLKSVLNDIVHSLYIAIVRTIGMGCFISELCYKGTILHRNYRKITILWSFSYNSFVKFHDMKKGVTT